MQTVKVELDGREFEAVDTGNMSPEEWDRYRSASLHIGGSDLGTVLGVNKYADAITLFCQKTGFIKNLFTPNEATEGGHFDEAAILKRLEFWDGVQWAANVRSGKTFRIIEKPQYTYLPSTHPYLALNVDGIIEHDIEYPNVIGVAEAKKIAGHVMAQYRGGCPPAYIAQASGYLTGLGLSFARIALLEDGVRLHVRTLDIAMEEFQYIREKIEAICPRFYQACVDGRQVLSSVPDDRKTDALMEVIAEYSDVLKVTHLSKEALDALAKEDRKVVIKDSVMDDVLQSYAEAEEGLKKANEKEGRIRNQIIEFLVKNDAQALEGTRYRASYNKRFNFKHL